MDIRPVQASAAAEWLRMRMALWPDSTAEKEASEIEHFLVIPPLPILPMLHAAYVCSRADGSLCGLAEVSIQPNAIGCTTSDVGYLEAWYVDPDVRQQGIGRRLAEIAEAWTRAQGCQEMASDTDATYPLSPHAHAQLGYEETSTPMHYRKWL